MQWRASNEKNIYFIVCYICADYDIYNSNSDVSYEYGTEDNLIELSFSSSNSFVHGLGDSSDSNLYDDNGNKITYTFTVDSLTEDNATITFTINN